MNAAAALAPSRRNKLEKGENTVDDNQLMRPQPVAQPGGDNQNRHSLTHSLRQRDWKFLTNYQRHSVVILYNNRRRRNKTKQKSRMKEADGAKVLTTRSVEFGIENVRLEFVSTRQNEWVINAI
ncbi:hypothetical protein DAPPUDRAFT_235751 [Daphnia pulex]|uniref:Uncharacterized protein n=1 Tax=Daphnia pulex TaxID=6669 RepID=E9G0R1_DAPPU|nr:hypothetical protein DAPPUDRAFT_235751 [Daphnia pulex]|eukprot:EFX86949.1 hypothetical protein DAPPUDRAFT_235751 [Daphnia pulex]